MRHSLFVYNDGTGREYELAMYHNTRCFPDPARYLRVTTKDGGVKGYLPLDEVGAEYDSGLRWTEAATGRVYQVCMKAATNVFRDTVHADNAVILCTSNDVLRAGLRSLFDERVTNEVSGPVHMTSPGPRSGVTQMLVVGLDFRIAVDDVSMTTSAGKRRALAEQLNQLTAAYTAVNGVRLPSLTSTSGDEVLAERLDVLEGLFTDGLGDVPSWARSGLALLSARVERLMLMFEQLAHTNAAVATVLGSVEWSTFCNGLNISSFGGDVSAVGRTMLLRLDPPHDYALSVDGDPWSAMINQLNTLSSAFALIDGVDAPGLVNDAAPVDVARRLDELEALFVSVGGRLDEGTFAYAGPEGVLIARLGRLRRLFTQLMGSLNVVEDVRWSILERLSTVMPAFNAVIVGSAVEALAQESSSYAALVDLEPGRFAVFNAATGGWDWAARSQTAAETLRLVQQSMLGYEGSHRTYNYYVLREPTYADL